jgi:hypothetical protein
MLYAGIERGTKQRMERLLKEDDALAKPVEWRAETQQWLDAWGTVQSAKAGQAIP